jgi:hypothetical protein
LSLARIWSASLVQLNGWQRWFQPSQNRLMAATSSWTLAKSPRRRAWRWMIAKNTSTRFSQEACVGVKCSQIRGCLASQAWTRWCLWVA